MDPCLVKIRDANMNLIKENRFGQAILQAKDYLVYVLSPNRMDQVNRELDDFVDSMTQIYQQNQASMNIQK
jgi:hypothetical protein